MLALGIGQALGQVGHGVVERQTAHGQLRFLGLLLLVLRRPLLRPPLVLLHLIHPVDGHHLAHPGLHHGVDLALAAAEVAGDVGDEVQAFLLAVHIEHHARGQRSDTGADGRHHRHRQLRTDGLDGVADALRELFER